MSRAAAEDAAAAEAAYRFARNDLVEASEIAEAGFAATKLRAESVAKIVADEDSTSLSYRHDVATELGDLGGPKNDTGHGFHVHSVLLTAKEWKVLWVTVEKNRPPKKAPTANWAYRTIARLGGWHDSKRTGRVGWQSYWVGWQRRKERIEGYETAKLMVSGNL